MPDQPLRPSSVRKRAAILDAARERFLADGYDRTSVDAVAAAAGVSKRTVYDHFTDKDGLCRAVFQTAATTLLDTVRRAAGEELRVDRDLREGALAFARRIATGTFRSSDYAVVRTLMDHGDLTGVSPDLAGEPERILASQLSVLAEAGLVRQGKAQRTAEHFGALTFMLALNQPHLEESAMDEIFVDGVDAFVRAYGQ
ncbi:TetR/AcrR family transcriptional regulator [Actinoplanes rectilineatus]|uniref:TetR/AcrR family transcriptional regulator n=1 Tax=Actinoplanes rectilineatus TaxID=113571 RepID=UPI000A5BBD35|nr:TetR/AcrR family transcriptional regulator [Actinoplanes rectilineatus]